MDTQKHGVTKTELLLPLCANDSISVLRIIHCPVESNLKWYSIFYTSCSYQGREMMKKVRYSLMSAFWKVKIESALKIYPR